MPRRFQPTGDRLSEHISEALGAVIEVEVNLDQMAQNFHKAGQAHVARWLWTNAGRLKMAADELRAAEAIRKELSPRRQAALSREAQKRRERK